jgi:hypothetical protein
VAPRQPHRAVRRRPRVPRPRWRAPTPRRSCRPPASSRTASRSSRSASASSSARSRSSPTSSAATATCARPPRARLRRLPAGHAVGSGDRPGRGPRRKLAEELSVAVVGNPARLDGLEMLLAGELFACTWTKDGETMPPFYRLAVTGIRTAEWTIPAGAEPTAEPKPAKRPDEGPAEGRRRRGCTTRSECLDGLRR